MGGFECADHINRSGERINLVRETEHDIRIEEDYALLHAMGIKVVREGVCWSHVETTPYQFNFDTLIPHFRVAKELGLQIIWDMCHFGYPDGLIPNHPQFCERFMALCEAFAKFHADRSNDVLMVVPVNEISFLSWHSGDVRGTVPFAVNSGDDIKYHLCKAAIQGSKAFKNQSPNCVIFAVEPLIRIHAADDTISHEALENINSNQFKAMDALIGQALHELGGSRDLVDILGFNYYYNNQWDHKNGRIHWPESKRKQIPFSQMLLEAYQRYQKPVVLTETGHFGHGREQFIDHITEECIQARTLGVDLRGICIYPVIDRPDWDNLYDYSNCGIWDLNINKERVPHIPSLKSCLNGIRRMKLYEGASSQ